ncbi:MAG: molybdopterin-dependent oxidoreductase [Candidatus Lindowbacteria bacterium]|nr:molybdopterin-dependent oxidoreductase [Candidatus Lindowbacteria bacterium]
MTTENWKSTACIMCGNNCGIEVLVEKDQIMKVRADKKNPFSKGYVCSKSLAVGRYQNHNQRVLSPLRRRPDGTFEEIDWDTATAEIADKLKGIIAKHGGKSVAFMGGGGQANHLDVPYAMFFLKALGTKYLYNALAQEYTQKYWINGHMFGSQNLDFHADEHRCDVFLIIGSNPWMSHGMQRARLVIGEIAKDPNRKLIVVDPRRHETAEKADIYLQIKPGTDTYFLLALINVIVRENLCDDGYLAKHTTGWAEVKWLADLVTPEKAAQLCDLKAEQIREVARIFAKAKKAATRIDLGIYHNIRMFENVYLERVLLALTGNLGVPGGVTFPESFMALDLPEGPEEKWKTRVVGIEQIRGMFPPNALPEEILTPGEDRIRAVFVEGSNPLRSYADSKKFEEAFKALDLLVVVEPAMSEAARLAHYVLPAKCGYEKFEASFFPKGFPGVYYHLRQPVVNGPELAKQECEIFMSILEKMGVDLSGLLPFAMLKQAQQESKEPPVLSLVGAFCMMFAMKHRDALIKNGIITGEGDDTSELFQAILQHPEGLYLCDTLDENNLDNLKTPDQKIHLAIPMVLDLLRKLPIPERIDLDEDARFPFILQTGERTNYTANTIQRDSDWRSAQLPTNYLRMSRKDAERLEVAEGETVKLVTERSVVSIPVKVTDDIYPGNMSIPHGFGLLHTNKKTGKLAQIGVNVNELIAAEHRDPFTGIPLHKYIRCRVEKH